jgi:iron complex outermembrane recepter protein
MKPSKLRFLIGAGLALASIVLSAQTPETGTITGRIFNPSTQEYIRSAEVKVEGTNLGTATEGSGYYELRNVPAGTVQLVATYPGAQSITATVTVPAGGTATKDFELSLTRDGASAGGEEVIQLETFVVQTEREGQSKMIAEQKQAMNIKQVVSADNFGDMSEQNIGEFLKYLPGITIDYVETDTRAASLGGMDPKYGYVTLDGNAQASGSSGSFGASDRQFEFESISMNNIESIEVNKTLTADMWGDAPAGTVNLRTRSSLDRKSPKGSVTAGVIWNSLENGFKKTSRHDDDVHAKTRPRMSFDYNSGAILGGKFGFTANGSFSSIYKEQFRHSIGYDYNSAQARAAGQPLVTSINYKDGPKIVDKYTGGVRFDYQPFPGVRMSVAGSYSDFNDFFANRNLNFVTSSANLGAGSSVNRVVANNSNNTQTRIDQTGESTGKLKDNTNLSYALNYKRGPWTADLSALYSRARERRGGLYYGTMGNTPIRLSRIGFIAERTGIDSGAWTINQTSGGDWYNWNNWGVFDGQDVNSNSQYGKTEQYTGKIDIKRSMDWSIPTNIKFGFGKNVTFKHRWVHESYIGRFVGNTGNALTALEPQSKAYFLIDEGFGGGTRPLPVVDKELMFSMMRGSPSAFTQSEANLASQLQNVLNSFNGNQEDITAAYVMTEHKIARWQFVAGVRFEGTNTRSTAAGQLPDQRNPFAFFDAVNGNYEPPASLTRNYIQHKYSVGKVNQYGEYNDWLPSAAAKYTINENLFLKLGYNKAIKRPDLNRIGGSWTLEYDDEEDEYKATIPNPNLKPERSERFSIMIEKYFKYQGSASIHVFQTNIKNAIDERPGANLGQTFAFDFPPETNVLSFSNIDDNRRFRGIELSYSQRLGFFTNEYLRAFSIVGTYSQFNVTPRPRNGTRFFPRAATGGVTWSYGKFYFQVNGTWTDETFVSETARVSNDAFIYSNDPEYFKPRTILFVNARYRITNNLSMFISGDRAYDSGKVWHFKSDGRIRQIENYGSQWSIGAKADF